MGSQRWLVVYDTSCDRRRRRMAKVLLRHGERIQWSTYEVSVTIPQHRLLLAALAALAQEGDEILVLPMTSDALCRAWRFGSDSPASQEDSRVF